MTLPPSLKEPRLNLAPLIDVLFILLVLFATAAISREVAHSQQIELAKVDPTSSEEKSLQAHALTSMISIDAQGDYFWNAQLRDYPLKNIAQVRAELLQRKKSRFFAEKVTPVYLRIDAKAPWEPIAQLIEEIEEQGFVPLALTTNGVEEE